MNKSNTQIFCYTEIWYLVKYEDDENLRVLAEDEIRHIFPDEEELAMKCKLEMSLVLYGSPMANTTMPRYL